MAFSRVPIALTYYIKLFRKVADRRNGILKEQRNYNRNLILYPPQKYAETQPTL